MKKEKQAHFHVRAGNLPLCIVGTGNSALLGWPLCGARSKDEAEATIRKCKTSLLKHGRDPSNWNLHVVEGSCPESK